MKMLTKEIREKMPKLRATEEIELAEKEVVVKFFDPTGAWTWYAVEGEAVLDEAGNEVDFEFFGLVDGMEKEWGYFTLNQLKEAKQGMRGLQGLPIERDMHFEGKKIKDIRG